MPAEKSDGAKEPEDVLPRQSRLSLNDLNDQYVKIENEQLVKGAAVDIRKQRKNVRGQAKPVSSKSAEKISGMMDVYFVI